MTIPYFENITLEKNDRYDVNVTLANDTFSLDLNDLIPENEADVAAFLENLVQNIAFAKGYIQNDWENGSQVKEYLEFHLDVIENENMEQILAPSDPKLTQMERLYSVLKLKRIGIYPANKDYFAILDFTIGRDFSNYLLVVTLQKDGLLGYITMES